MFTKTNQYQWIGDYIKSARGNKNRVIIKTSLCLYQHGFSSSLYKVPAYLKHTQLCLYIENIKQQSHWMTSMQVYACFDFLPGLSLKTSICFVLFLQHSSLHFILVKWTLHYFHFLKKKKLILFLLTLW